jgi:hypothetical protein
VKTFLSVLMAGLLCSPAWSHDVLLVSRASDLHFVPLKDCFLHVRSRLEGGFSLFNGVRRAAFNRLADAWGLPAPDRKQLAIGCVARPDASGRVAYALVLKGDIDGARLKDHLVKRHANFFQKRGLTANPEAVEVQGQKGVRLAYTERPCVFELVPMGRYFVIASLPSGDSSLVEEVVTALKSPESLGKGQPAPFAITARMTLTPAERKRVTEFKTQFISNAINKIRDRFMKLHNRLRPGGGQEEDLKSLDERLNEQFLKAASYDLTLNYQPGAGENDDRYTARYVANFASEADAKTMKELVLEKIEFFKENAESPGVPVALNTAHLDVSGNGMVADIRLDTREQRFDALYTYVALLLSLPNTNQDLDIVAER